VSRRAKRKGNADIRGFAMIGFAVVMIAVIFLFINQEKQGHVSRDKASMCRLDGSISRNTVIIIDATDNFSNTQGLLVKKEMESLLESALVDEQFTIYLLGEDVDDSAFKDPIISVCNPGDGSDKNEYTSNLRRLKKKWEEDFYLKITSTINNLIGDYSANKSPIMEMIKYASVNSLYGSKAKQARMIIISDMLHFTNEYSQYTQAPSFESFKKLPYSLETSPQLSQVAVSILYLVRSKNMSRQNRGHIEFWNDFISSHGGKLTKVKRIN